MKLKYIDIKNFKALLPMSFGMAQLREFDSYLEVVNNEQGYKGIITKLIDKNQKTQNKLCWDRLLHYDIDICLTMDFKSNELVRNVQDYSKPPAIPRTGLNKKVDAMFSLIHPEGLRWTYRLPLQYILKGWCDANDGYQCYVHSIKFSDDHDEISPFSETQKKVEFSYTGITGRNWLKRLEEHMQEVRGGSNKLFHRAWRASIGKGMVYTSVLQAVNLSYEQAMAWEEMYVDKWSLTPKGYNMIPGGFKGLQFLHEHRITDRIDISLEERDRAIAEYVHQNPRKGIPNPFMAELWEDDDFYLKVMEARSDRLSAAQVRQIRSLAQQGWAVSEITKEVGALSDIQVKRVIDEKTYTRVH